MAIIVTVPQPQMTSSSGLTGRSSMPRRMYSTADVCEYWMPACAGMTKENDEGLQ
jgi:hypothetical protein